MLKEARSSLEVLRHLEDQAAPVLCQDRHLGAHGPGPGFESSVAAVHVDPTSGPLPQGPHPGGSKQAERRRRLRNKLPPPLSRKDNMARGRLQKAARSSLHTQAEVHHLKPGLKFDGGEPKVYTLEELHKKGFQLVPWDGMSVRFFLFRSGFSPNPLIRNPVPILSKNEEVFLLLAGRPADVSYLEDLQSLERSMHRARQTLGFSKDHLEHRRGNYPVQSTGISYGGGSKVGFSFRSSLSFS